MSQSHPSARIWRRPVAIGAALAVTAGLSVGFTMTANASGGGSTTAVSFIAVNPAFKLLTAKSMATNTSLNEVVSGGRTTVPSDATTVELNVEAGGTTAGVLNFHPTGNVGGGSGQFLSWSGGGTSSATIQENVGASDELTFALTGATAKVTATITGYSTQVTDGDVSGLDGQSGQVLTDNGTGAGWQTPSVAAGGVTPAGGTAGQVLTNTGTVSHWATPSVGASNITPTGGTAGQVLTNTGSGATWSAVSTPLKWTTITPQNGCTTNGFGGGVPGVAVDASGVVHFRGEIDCTSNGTAQSLQIFTLPPAFWPSQVEYDTVDLAGSLDGRLQIDPNGLAVVEQNPVNPISDPALNFISLAGVSYTLPY